MRVKIKKLHPMATIPTYEHEQDLIIVNGIPVPPFCKNNQVHYDTGLSFEIPPGYVGFIYPRSSIRNTDLSLSNSVGVIDSGYRGGVSFTFNLKAGGKKIYKVGERIGQLIILPYPTIEFEEVDELSDSERGTGGFGHTGK